MNFFSFFNKQEEHGSVMTATECEPTDTQAEIAAAIAFALELYAKEKQQQHNAVLTLERQTHNYSPWNSKLYGMRQDPLHIPGLTRKLKL